MKSSTPELTCTPQDAALEQLVEQCARFPIKDIVEHRDTVVAMYLRVLDIAAEVPGGWAAVIDGLKASRSLEEVKAFCRAFTMTLAAAAPMDEVQAVHDLGEA